MKFRNEPSCCSSCYCVFPSQPDLPTTTLVVLDIPELLVPESVHLFMTQVAAAPFTAPECTVVVLTPIFTSAEVSLSSSHSIHMSLIQFTNISALS